MPSAFAVYTHEQMAVASQELFPALGAAAICNSNNNSNNNNNSLAAILALESHRTQ